MTQSVNDHTAQGWGFGRALLSSCAGGWSDLVEGSGRLLSLAKRVYGGSSQRKLGGDQRMRGMLVPWKKRSGKRRQIQISLTGGEEFFLLGRKY